MSLRKFNFGLAVVIAAGLTPMFGCSHHSNLAGDGTHDLSASVDGGSNPSGDGGSDLALDAASCFSASETCATGAECCSGACDSTTHVCVAGTCQPDHGSCQKPTDCCNLNCNGGVCGSSQCLSDGQDCSAAGSVCCSTMCANGKCAPLNSQCKTAGNACNGPGDCCSQACESGHCAAPSQVSYCTQAGDICFQGNECCTGVCTIQTGASAGTCTPVTSGCSVDGTVCNGCTGCCSSYCAPFGISGSKICQPASGCHVLGDLCKADNDCCGGDVSSGLPGAGLVKCVPVPGHPEIGTCSAANPTNCPGDAATCKNACQPEGDVCHFKNNGGCASNSFPDNCCDAQGNKGECKLDSVGVPRCYGLGTACVMAGNACASSDDCCDGLPCVPDNSGHLICAATSCVPEGGVCTTTADCCTGLPCQVPPGALRGTCINLPPPPPPDGGTSDLAGVDLSGADLSGVDQAPPPTCALYGQSCSTTVPCCQGTGANCYQQNSTNLCQPGNTNCFCTSLIL